MEVGIREFKAKLSHYLDLVKQGELLVVTNRGKPIVRLEPVLSEEPSLLMQRLIAEGKVVYKGRIKHLPEPIKLLPGDKTLSDYVIEQRGDPLRGF